MFEQYPDVVTTMQLAEMLKTGKSTVYKLLRNGQIRSVKVGRKYIIPKQSVVDFLDDLCYNELRIVNGRQNQQSAKGELL